MRAIAHAALLSLPSALAPWVPLSDSVDAEGEVGASWVLLGRHRLVPASGYDPDALGNLDGVGHLLPLHSARNHALVAPIAVGTPPQRLTCLLDASGADLWLPSARCESCAADSRELAGFFKARQSSSFRPGVVQTPFGVAPVMRREVYGGGSAAGFIVEDDVEIGGLLFEEQMFVLAEAGGQDVKRERSWDGVCGLGRQGPSLQDGQPIFQRLPELHKASLLALAPGPKFALGPASTDAVLAAGAGSTFWVPALQGPSWLVQGAVRLAGLGMETQQSARFILETGTSFLLAPPHAYLPFVRTLLPDGHFDRLCGVDDDNGNMVICDCAARSKMIAGISILLGQDGAQEEFSLLAADMLEEVRSSPGSMRGRRGQRLCVLQVQQRPGTASPGSLFGPLGPPHDVEGDTPEVLSTDAAATQAQGRRRRQTPDSGALLGPRPELPAGHSVKEVSLAPREDGGLCRTEVIRAANGTVLNVSTVAITPDGHQRAASGPECGRTRLAGEDEALHPVQPPPFLDGPAQRRLGTGKLGPAGVGSPELFGPPPSDVWVLGDVFFKRRTLLLDYENGRVGVERADRGAASVAAATAADGAADSRVMARVSPPHSSEGARHIRDAATILMGRASEDEQASPLSQLLQRFPHASAIIAAAVVSGAIVLGGGALGGTLLLWSHSTEAMDVADTRQALRRRDPRSAQGHSPGGRAPLQRGEQASASTQLLNHQAESPAE